MKSFRQIGENQMRFRNISLIFKDAENSAMHIAAGGEIGSLFTRRVSFVKSDD